MESENIYAAPQATGSPPPVEKKKLPAALSIAIAFGVFLLFMWLLIPTSNLHKVPSTDTKCLNQLKQIGLAMLNYESANGHFPPAYIADENGKPMHSWRVLILPQLDQQALFDRYDMDEPWDGPNNSKLHDQIVDCYRCPSSTSNENLHRLRFDHRPSAQGLMATKRFDIVDITDGSSNTIVATEIAGSKIHWMQPQDITQNEFLGIERDNETPSNHPGCRNVVNFDGSTHSLSPDGDLSDLRKLTLIADGEVVDIDAVE